MSRFGLLKEKFPGTTSMHYDTDKAAGKGPWIETGKELKPCWQNPAQGELRICILARLFL